MPIRTGSRLERLQALQRQTRHELASAQRRDLRHESKRLAVLDKKLTAAIKVERGDRVERVQNRLADLGVTSTDVKVWAVSVGLLDAVRRGRIKASLVEAYAEAHPTTSKDFPTS